MARNLAVPDLVSKTRYMDRFSTRYSTWVMPQRAASLLFAASLTVGCVGLGDGRPTASVATQAPTPTIPEALRRPLATDAVTRGCNPSIGRDASEVPGAVGFRRGGYVAFGDGPIYPAFTSDDRREAVLIFDGLPEATWLGPQQRLRLTKVLWISAPGAQGDVLVRVVPGSPLAAFGGLNSPAIPEKFFSIGGDDSGGYVLFSSRGCYRFQIDGAGFSTLLTVDVR